MFSILLIPRALEAVATMAGLGSELIDGVDTTPVIWYAFGVLVHRPLPHRF